MARPKLQINRKDDILDAAQILFTQKGFEKTTIQEIADHIGIGKGSVYLDFKNKNEIYLGLAERFVTSLVQKAEMLVNTSDKPSLELFNIITLNHVADVYDKSTSQFHTYVALMHTSYHAKQKLQPIIQNWFNLLANLLEKAAKNNEIKEFNNYNELAQLICTSFLGFFPPYDTKYSSELRTDLTKQEIRTLILKDASFVMKIVLSGLKNVNY
jgi:AcrR family transcriptional regulator